MKKEACRKIIFPNGNNVISCCTPHTVSADFVSIIFLYEMFAFNSVKKKLSTGHFINPPEIVIIASLYKWTGGHHESPHDEQNHPTVHSFLRGVKFI